MKNWCEKYGNQCWKNQIYKIIENAKIICKIKTRFWSHRLAVRTSDSHSDDMGSIPIGTAKFRYCAQGAQLRNLSIAP